jgi:hypothetical protein
LPNQHAGNHMLNILQILPNTGQRYVIENTAPFET